MTESGRRLLLAILGGEPVPPKLPELTAAQAVAPSPYYQAMVKYEIEIRPLHHEWAVERGREVWARKRPWFVSLT